MGLRRYSSIDRDDVKEILYGFLDIMNIYFTAERAEVSPLEYELRAILVTKAHKLIDLLES